MTSLYQAAQQALEALESRCQTNAEERGPAGAITALRAIERAHGIGGSDG